MRQLIPLMTIAYLIEALVSNPGLCSLPITLYLKETLHLSATAVASFGALALLPWMVKPFWGLICDSFALLGYQLKSYFVICYMMTTGIFLTLSFSQTYTIPLLVIAAISVSICIAFSDVLTDRLMVSEGQLRQKTVVLQAAQWAAFGIGSGIALYMGSRFAAQKSLSFVFGVSAAIPLAGLVGVLWLLPEQKVAPGSVSPQKTIQLLWSSLRSRQVIALISFIALLGFSPVPPLLFYERDGLQFSETFVGDLSAISALASGLGAICFGIFAQRLLQHQLLNGAVGFSILSTLSLILIRTPETAVLAHALTGFTSMLSGLAVMELAAQICSAEIAGTSYALLLSVNNLAINGGAILGGWLYDKYSAFDWLALTASICAALCWFTIPFLKLQQL